VYEKGKQPSQRATTVQGVEKGYFGYVNSDGTLEESLERQLANIEAECNAILPCTKSELFNWQSHAHRKTIARYAALLFQRATQARNVNEQHWDYIQKGFFEAVADDKLVADLATYYGRKFNRHFTLAEMRVYLQPTIEGMQRPSEAKNVFLEKLLWNTDFIQNDLLDKPWQVWTAPIGVEFATSDNPLISFVRLSNGMLHPGWGFRRPGVIAAFPLAPTTCLAMGPTGPEFVRFDAEHVMKINELIVCLCDRFVYSRTRSEEIRKLVDMRAGTAKYGVSAFVPSDTGMPSVGAFLRHHLGLPPEDGGIALTASRASGD
jgi:hypothetical protein